MGILGASVFGLGWEKNDCDHTVQSAARTVLDF